MCLFFCFVLFFNSKCSGLVTVLSFQLRFSQLVSFRVGGRGNCDFVHVWRESYLKHYWPSRTWRIDIFLVWVLIHVFILCFYWLWLLVCMFKKKSRKKRTCHAVGHPAKISSLFYIEFFSCLHHQFSLGLFVRKNYVCVTVFCSATFLFVCFM